MLSKDKIALTLAEGAAVTALIGLGGVALPLAAAAYGVYRFMPEKLAKVLDKAGDEK